jgi:crotonobetaine/carnitine-CoA ligase
VYGIPAASGAPGVSDLVAAITPLTGKTIDPKIIYDKCKKDLESNFIPSFLQIVSEIPKTISEKALDRKLRDDFLAGGGTIFKFEEYR